MTRTVASTTFNQDTASVKRAVDAGETIIVTNHGNPALVVLPIAEYQRLTERDTVIGSRLQSAAAAAIDLPLPMRSGWTDRATGLEI